MDIGVKHKRILILVGLLLVSPGTILFLVDPTYQAWTLTFLVPMNALRPSFSVDTHPSNPVVPEELVSVFVANSTNDPIENATVLVAYINGSVVTTGETSFQGIFQFDFPGDVVSITVQVDESQKTIIKGLIPSHYFIVSGISVIGWFIILLSLLIRRRELSTTEKIDDWAIQEMNLAQAVQQRLETPLLELKAQINVSTKSEKSEFIKDIMAMANRCLLDREKGFIVVGPQHDNTTPDFFDDADYQNIVNNKLQSRIEFLFRLFEHDNVVYGVFIIQPIGTIPILAKKYVGRNNRLLLNEGECWQRQGTKKTRLNSEQIVRLAHDIATSKRE